MCAHPPLPRLPCSSAMPSTVPCTIRRRPRAPPTGESPCCSRSSPRTPPSTSSPTTAATHAPATTQLGLEMLRGVLDTGRDTVAYAGRETASYAARDTGGEIGGALWQLGAKWHLHDGDEVWAHAQSSTATLVRCRS